MLTRDEMLSHLKARRPVAAPSMLKCDFGNLHREIELLDTAKTSLLHWDVMDGHFVPNLSYGPMVIERVRPLTGTPFVARSQKVLFDAVEDYNHGLFRQAAGPPAAEKIFETNGPVVVRF